MQSSRQDVVGLFYITLTWVGFAVGEEDGRVVGVVVGRWRR